MLGRTYYRGIDDNTGIYLIQLYLIHEFLIAQLRGTVLYVV